MKNTLNPYTSAITGKQKSPSVSFLSKQRLSITTVVFIAIAYIFSLHYMDKWRTGILGGGDGWGYYLYLPAIFIHEDLDNLRASLDTRLHYMPGTTGATDGNNPLGVEEVHLAWSGKEVNKYTIGLAIIYSPFFFIAHVLAKIFNLPADGYSAIYMYFIHLSSIVYVILGLILLRKILLHYFSDIVTSITLLLVTLGTNLYYFTTYNSVMAHSYLFSLYCLLIFATINWYKNPNWKSAFCIGLAAGFITLIRPTEIICLFIPLLWGITSFSDLKLRFKWFGSNYKSLLIAILTFAAAGIPQLLYWKAMTGYYLYYSYGQETFDFKNPEIFKGLFGFRNGWLAYTPLMYLAVLGIFALARQKRKDMLLPILFFLPIHIYIIYSWWCWYYINGFGSRPMVETYALLSLPLAVSVKIISQKRLLALMFIPVAAFFIWLNIFNTYQIKEGILWSEMGNWAYYKGIIGKSQLDYQDLVRFDLGDDQPEEAQMLKEKLLYQTRFENAEPNSLNNEYKERGLVLDLNNDYQYSPGYSASVEEMSLKPNDWIKITIDYLSKEQTYNLYQMNSLITEFKRGEESLQWKSIRLDNKQGKPAFDLRNGALNTWGTVSFWIKIPEKIKNSDNFKCYVWNGGAGKILLDNLIIEHYKKK